MIDRNETYTSRLLADNGESKDYIGLLSNKLPFVARIERGTPIKFLSRLSTLHPHSALWEELSSLDEAFPVVAVGFSAYLLFCRTEVGGEVGYHNFDNWEYIGKEQCYQLYIDKLFHLHKGANKELYSIKVANGKEDEFRANFLSSLCKEEKAHLKKSMALGYIDSNIIKGTKEFIASLTKSEEEQANEPPYLFEPRGIDFSNILSLLKEVKLVDETLTFLDFLAQIRNGKLGCIDKVTYKRIVIKEVGKKMGEDWLDMVLDNENLTKESLIKSHPSREKYNVFAADLRKIIFRTEHW